MRNLLFFLIAVFIICIFASSINFYLGSNSHNYITPFDYIGSIWYCEKYDIKAEVYGGENVYMILTTSNGENYILLSLDKINVELYKGKEVNIITSSKSICKPTLRATKIFGQVYGFNLKWVQVDSLLVENAFFVRQGAI